MAFQKIGKSNTEYTGQNELNIINAGTFLEGTIETKGSVQINGKLKGLIKAGDEVRVGRSGEIFGEIYAKNARIAGKVEGNIYIEERLTLEDTSSLNGNLSAGKLIIDEGAFFNGHADMSGNKLKALTNGKGDYEKSGAGNKEQARDDVRK
ncbi:MAG: polymer-forming cytoskeletal protein [Calditrichia bacterium]